MAWMNVSVCGLWIIVYINEWVLACEQGIFSSQSTLFIYLFVYKGLTEGLCFQRSYWTLIRLPWYDLNSLTFTLSTAASGSLVSGHAQSHQNKFLPPRRTPLLLRGCRVKRCLKEPALGVISARASDTVAASDQTQTAQSCRRCLNMHVYILPAQLVYFVFDIKIVAF